jgi:hypothetical protein
MSMRVILSSLNTKSHHKFVSYYIVKVKKIKSILCFGDTMPRGADIAEEIIDYLKGIHPGSATKKEIFSNVGVAGCAGESWIKTLVAGREIEVCGKRGSSNLYCYSGN